jgi:UTP-glucose-1-phosphate uridylyltransferase
MKKPSLVVMAAGMGSRYGGLKQIDPVGKNGELIIDFSLFDARKAGFNKVVFVISREIEKDFKRMVGNRISRRMEVHYAFQDIADLPEGFKVPEGRVKPWGTGHAVLSCSNLIDEPFAVINADDYYGRNAFRLIHDYLGSIRDEEKYHYAMVGYILENTLTDYGHVARGVCEVSEEGCLKAIHERTHIENRDGAAMYTEDGVNWTPIPGGSTVSMNLWGFSPDIFNELGAKFPMFLNKALVESPVKAEYFLPTVVDALFKEKKAVVKVLKSEDRWYGVTYREDKPMVMDAIEKMQEAGIYPDRLWEE